jgi:hypothetical protein
MYMNLYVFFIAVCILALHVSGAICTHPQEHKLQHTTIGVCNLWKAEVIHSIKRCGVIFLHELVGMCVRVLIIQSYGFLA